mmetsp:Transcript_3772/g.4775  ORF Transcript_3772/g.4775 Transcript_3772/m.4775 type:complete len:785 (+) Transcript_3772:61-2415(+)
MNGISKLNEKQNIDGGSETNPNMWKRMNHINQAIHKLKRKRKYIYSTASPCFNLDIFFEQFLQHVFYPFSIIFMYRKYGQSAIQNQSPTGILATIAINSYWVIFFILCFSSKELNKNGITISEIIISLFTGTVFRCVVSSKYASMSWKEYIKYLTCDDEKEAKQMQKQMQLITGWFYIDAPFCVHEATLAMSRMGFHESILNQTTTLPPPPFEIYKKHVQCWKSILGKHGSMLHINDCPRSDYVHVDCADLMALIVSANNPKINKKYLVFMTIPFGILFGCIPGLVRVSCKSISQFLDFHGDNTCISNSFFGNGGYANFVSVLLILHTVYSMVPLTLFFLVTLCGNIRHYQACRTYGLLVRADTKSPPVSVCPVVDLEIPNNIRAWVRSRLALHFFGMRYYQRMDIYAKLCAIILICMLLWLYIFAAQISGNENGSSMLFIDIRYWVVCYLLLVWGASFGLILISLAETNVELRAHEIEFLLHRLTIREKRHIYLLNDKNKNNDCLGDDKENIEKTLFHEKKKSHTANEEVKYEGEEEEQKNNEENSSLFYKKVTHSSQSLDPIQPNANPEKEKKKKDETMKVSFQEENNKLLLSQKDHSNNNPKKTLDDSEEEEETDAWFDEVFGLNQSTSTSTSKKRSFDNKQTISPLSLDNSTENEFKNEKEKEIKNTKNTENSKTLPSSSKFTSPSPVTSPSTPSSASFERAELTRIMSSIQSSGIEALQKEELDDLMDTAVMITEAQMRINPRRFLGADASWAFVVSYLAAWGALIAFVLNVAGIDYQA